MASKLVIFSREKGLDEAAMLSTGDDPSVKRLSHPVFFYRSSALRLLRSPLLFNTCRCVSSGYVGELMTVGSFVLKL